MDIGRGRSTMNVALWVVQGLLAALSRQLSTKQPSRKEETMSTGGFSKARLGRMHDVMGFFCGLTVGLTLVATPAGIARNVIESMPSSSSSHSSVPRGWL